MSSLSGVFQQTEVWNAEPGSVLTLKITMDNSGTFLPGRYLVTYERIPDAQEEASAGVSLGEILQTVRAIAPKVTP